MNIPKTNRSRLPQPSQLNSENSFRLEPRIAPAYNPDDMTRLCQQCGAEVPEGSPVCRSCFEPVKSEGFLARLVRLLGGGTAKTKTPTVPGTAVKIHTTERIKIRNPLTGELHEYHSLDEVPAELREQVRKAREAAASVKGANLITVTDSEGKVQTYHSVDELPPELRALYQQAREGKS